ncbi:hypothetical protein G6O69_35735 [Pseudenhygromyxa sp. WMMC2535]|uniref:hypothetical protein n=1 Tax=Pseudenhygromyxa sp. WMMC2535 TaxID=2712867 RepID=UPI0015950EB8|nr:hypothetical protein [Pseudenhygromyxa sp. WMMC2535]NVB43231.1 hypothetical protein [Pseudenhygromyxa sp. WMMC2535]
MQTLHRRARVRLGLESIRLDLALYLGICSCGSLPASSGGHGTRALSDIEHGSSIDR